MASWVGSETAVDAAAALCLANKVFMTAPNSVVAFLFPFSLSTGVVSRALALVGRVEMSVGVRIMGFWLEQVFSGRVVVAWQRQRMAADHFLMWLMQFAHQFCSRHAKNCKISSEGVARDLLQGVEKPTPHSLV
jgi:hypothetical protein